MPKSLSLVQGDYYLEKNHANDATDLSFISCMESSPDVLKHSPVGTVGKIIEGMSTRDAYNNLGTIGIDYKESKEKLSAQNAYHEVSVRQKNSNYYYFLMLGVTSATLVGLIIREVAN